MALHQRLQTPESSLPGVTVMSMSLAVTAPCQAGVTSKTMCERQSCPASLQALAGLTTNGQLPMILYIT